MKIRLKIIIIPIEIIFLHYCIFILPNLIIKYITNSLFIDGIYLTKINELYPIIINILKENCL